MTIPVLNVDLQPQSGIWAPALAQHLKSARSLLGAFNKEAERQASSVIGGQLILGGVKIATNHLNKLLGRHFRKEIEELAELLDTSPSEVLLANLAYDLANSGCSTFVQSLPSIGTLHARNLDWGFPRDLLKKHLVAAHVRNGKHRSYSIVTWPGLFGVLTGVAQGRFAITVNYVRHADESNWKSLAARAIKGYWPVTWLVRKIFDEEKDYNSALERLRSAPILAPVLFAISGPKPGQGAVIEREADEGEPRKLSHNSNGFVCVTNHYVSPRLAQLDAGDNMLDSTGRLAFLERELSRNSIHDAKEALQLLSKPRLRNSETQYQVAMSASDGSLVIRVPGARAIKV